MTSLCPACSHVGDLRYGQNIDVSKMNSATYSSRKRPEFMHYDYFECRRCKSLFTCEVATEDLIASYQEAPLGAISESRFAARTYRDLILRYQGLAPTTLLDIGCGDGAFLSLMADAGTTLAHGVEPSEHAVAQCSDHRISIIGQTIENLKVNIRYEAVCLFQTIEHLGNPRATLQAMSSLCSQSGSIYVICHDRHAPVNRLLGTRSPIFDIEHLQLFTKLGLSSLINSTGMDIQHLQHFTNRYPLSYILRLAFPEIEIRTFPIDPVLPLPLGNLFLVATPRT